MCAHLLTAINRRRNYHGESKVVDVTLRDGGYRNNFNFTDEQALVITSSLAEAGINVCEVGYCRGSFAPKVEHGLTSNINADFIERVRQAGAGRIELAVMVHPKNVGNEDFAMLKEQGISMIRVCLRREQLTEGLATLSLARDYGFSVSANVTHVTAQTLSAVIDTSVRAEGAGADIICFADSNGHMLPSDVDRLISRLSTDWQCHWVSTPITIFQWLWLTQPLPSNRAPSTSTRPSVGWEKAPATCT